MKAAHAPVEQPDRLSILAIKINAAHGVVKCNIKATIAEMMSAGDALREAKGLAGHGNWLSWLKANCPELSERTAHLYMQLAKWRSVVEDAMAKSAMVADFERDQLRVPMGLAVGPFGVADAIAAIHEAEHHETMVRENRLRLAGELPGELPAAKATWDTGRAVYPPERLIVELRLELQDFSNYVKCRLSRLGIDPHQRAEFFKQAHGILDALETQRSDVP
jgi:hypothetical protein